MEARAVRSARPLAIALAAVLLVGSVMGAEMEVSGHVVDGNNTPVPNVRVTLMPDHSPESGSPADEIAVTSNAAGTFSVQVHPGAYLLSAEREGFFAIHEKRIELSGAESLNIVLQQLQQTSESINVSASIPAVDRQDTTSERTITGRQIIDIPYPATRDFRSALRIMPGVMRQPSGRLIFDGGTEDQVFFSLNGFNIGDPVTGRFSTRLPVESVRSVEYASGRYSPEFGKGSAGTLAIQTNNGEDQFRYSATNFIPGLETQKGLHISTWSPRFTFSGPIRRGRAWFSENLDTEYSVAIIPDLPRGQDRTTRWRGTSITHGQVNLTPTQILSFDLLGSYENAPRTGLSALDPVSTSLDRGAQQYFASIKDQMYFARGIVLDVGYAHNAIGTYEHPQGSAFYIITPNGRNGNYFVRSNQQSQRDQWLMNVFAPSFQLAGTHQVKTGIDIDVVHYSQDAQRTGYENYDRNKRLLSRTTFAGPASLAIRNAQLSSYVVDSWTLRQGLTFEYGVRQDWDELVRQVVFSPRFSVAYAPFGSTRTTIAAGYGVVHDASSLSMFARALDQYSMTTTFGLDGNPVNAPSITMFRTDNRYRAPGYRNLSFGFEERLSPKLRFSASVLRRRGTNGFTYHAGTSSIFDENNPLTIFELTNLRRDVYDSVSFTVQRSFGKDYVWMVNYIRSRALSNAVIDLSVDQPLRVVNYLGRLAWDAPNHLLSWGYLPTWSPKWAISYLLDARTGFPFSVVRDTGEVVGAVNSYRFPMNLQLNLHIERKFRLRGYRFAFRAGVNNVTNSMNATGVNNVIDSPNFLYYYGREGRHGVFRLRLLKQGE